MDLSKSIENLEGDIWDAAGYPSTLAEKCFELRRVALNKLSPEDLRLLIGQRIGLPFIVPLALSLLESDILISGDLYKGDLLQSIGNIDNDFWQAEPDLNNRMVELTAEIEGTLCTLKELLPNFQKRNFK